MKKFTTFVILILVLTVSSTMNAISAPATDMTLRRQVDAMLGELRIDAARQTLQDAASSQGLSDPELLHTLAMLESYVYRNHEVAFELVNQAILLDSELLKHQLLLGEILFDMGDNEKGIEVLNAALEHESVESPDLFAEGYLLLAKHYSAIGKPDRAKESLEQSAKLNPYNSEVNYRLHAMHVMSKEYAKAYDVWKRENLISERSAPFLPRLAAQNRVYQEIVSADVQAPFARAELYSNLGMFDEARIEYERDLELADNQQAAAELRDVTAFIDFRDEMKAILNAYYRTRSIEGVRAETRFYEGLEPAYRTIATLLFPDLSNEPFSRNWVDKLNRRIVDRFGYNITFLSANGRYLGAHFGHVADQYTVEVNQLGQSANLRLTILRNMVSNGLAHWFRKGNGGVGGWNTTQTDIVSVLGPVGGLLTLFDYLNDEKFGAMLDQARVYDVNDKRTEPNAVFFAQELSHTLIRNQLDVEVAAANNLGITENDEFVAYLISQFLSNYFDTNIIAHEGRHAMDATLGLRERWFGEYEYRAKLAELAYGTMQYFTLRQFHLPTLGSTHYDRHIQGNNRVFTDIVNHIVEKSEDYPTIDVSRNVMMQLSSLTEQEIQAIALTLLENAN